MLTSHSPDHMTTLYNICVAPKVWRSFPEGSHNDTYCEPDYFDEILVFVQKIVRGEKVGIRKRGPPASVSASL